MNVWLKPVYELVTEMNDYLFIRDSDHGETFKLKKSKICRMEFNKDCRVVIFMDQKYANKKCLDYSL